MLTRTPYDLHLHTEWSYDAGAQLADYFRSADAHGLRCIGTADHNNWDAAHEAPELLCRYPSVRLVAGAELYVKARSLDGVWLHLLCYNLSPHSSALEGVASWYHRWAQAGGAALVDALVSAGGRAPEEADPVARACRPAKTMPVQGLTHTSRAMIAGALEARGRHVDDELLSAIHAQMWERTPDIPFAEDVVPDLKKGGALTVLAHPNLLDEHTMAPQLSELAAELMLDGIECAHPGVPVACTPVLRSYCLEHSLVSTAGSDNHGFDDIEGALGVHAGEIRWLDEFLERITV